MRQLSILGGVGLIFLGGLLLTFTLLGPLVGLAVVQLWPLIVVGVGLACAAPPLLARGRPGLGGLFIPAVPILTTGVILLWASLFNAWGIWIWLWPMEVLG